MTLSEHKAHQEVQKLHRVNNPKISKLINGQKGHVNVNEGEMYTFAFTVTNAQRINKELTTMDITIDKVYMKPYWGNESFREVTFSRMECDAKQSTWDKRIAIRLSESGRYRTDELPSDLPVDYNNRYAYYIHGTKYLHLNKIDWSKVK